MGRTGNQTPARRRPRKASPRKKGSPRGGRRTGAGRKAAPAKSVRWRFVREAARAGATQDEIVKALALPREVLQDAEAMRRLRDEIVQGHAELNIRIRKARVRRAVSGGSVQLLMQMAPIAAAGDGEPDWDDLDGRLTALLEKLEEARES